MRKYDIKKGNIKLHNILYSITSEIDYSMDRLILLKDMPNTINGFVKDENGNCRKIEEYVLVEGGHCSCYDFDETQWDAVVYEKEELIKLLDDKNTRYDDLRQKLKSFLKYYGWRII